ncbi:MAG TPA: amidohydrolase, partial [Longimicrobiales bacterium]|nr:amidohydrolase [Longimicrobiales bacterium]
MKNRHPGRLGRARGRRVPSLGLATAVPVLALVLGACGAADSTEPADLVLTNGHVVTVDSTRPEAEAVAIEGDRIVAVGSARDIRRYVGEGTRVIDLEGRLAIPGFIEGHGHYLGLGRARMILDLTTARTWDDIVAMVGEAAAAARPGEWIEGRGWHQEKWEVTPEPSVDGVPLHTELSAASPENPVVLGHASGHASFVNARALELAGIGRATADPPGGEIVRDASGEPTGLLRERAQGLVSRVQANEPASEGDQEARFREMVRLAGEEALAKGVTGFHDAGSSFATIDRLKALADRGELPIRLYVMVRRESNAAMDSLLPRYRMQGHAGGFLTVRSIKRQIDGALGAHGAWLLEPYEDLPTSSGLTLEDPADIAETARIALEHGYQVNTHAIGDRANREVLDIYERAFREGGASGDTLRWRIEHAQHIHPDDIRRFADLGVIAAMQGIHGTSDGPWVAKRLGEERAASGAYLWRSLLDAGVVVTNGTDVPVEDIDPIASFYASVSRRVQDGSLFYPEQRMTRDEALRSYTLANAFAAFEEADLGSITPGKLADIVVLS